ncbi:hypothetical protein QBC40DRAFT_302856 [Triangularia verruculosa]|uniref:Uncharacterized protein n=1 Tax=Triangularia verruculosa TaxID=2587418 RepID=A0AAN6XQW3_9PEZI|nr:hypothetical protein QBC40DRAFT_302856 [Triangularia verruculosa]
MKRKIFGRLSIVDITQPPQHREIAAIGEEKYTLTLHITPQLEVADLELDTGNLLAPTCFDGLTPSEEQVEEQDADTAAILIPYRNLRTVIKDFTRPALVEYFIDRALIDYLPHTDLWHHIKAVSTEADVQNWPERTISLAIEASLRAQDYEAFEHITSNGQNKSSCDLVAIVEKATMMRPGCFDEPQLQRG